VFEFVSKAPVVAADGITYKQYFTVDTDLCMFEDRALIMGLKWRFFAQKGLNWVALRTDYRRYVDALKARDGGNTTKSLIRSPSPYLVDSNQVQDGFFPGAGLQGYTGS
jgi:hypothetical protein